MNIAIIPAGGQGRRMSSLSFISEATPKQFLPLAGVPLIIRTLLQFESCADIDAIQVVLPAEEIARGEFQNMAAAYKLKKLLPLVAGGKERQNSVHAGLEALAISPFLNSGIEIVVIHDAVRPFISPQLISLTITTARSKGGAICAIPATDTIKEVREGTILRTLPRGTLYQAQTPQTFRYELILAAHRRAANENFPATDDAMLVEWYGNTVAIVEGTFDNIKVTQPVDLILAEMILNRTKPS
jgi:2-C-methyl-D-erythritol 4-phosphate cytidylyltransferase